MRDEEDALRFGETGDPPDGGSFVEIDGNDGVGAQLATNATLRWRSMEKWSIRPVIAGKGMDFTSFNGGGELRPKALVPQRIVLKKRSRSGVSRRLMEDLRDEVYQDRNGLSLGLLLAILIRVALRASFLLC